MNAPRKRPEHLRSHQWYGTDGLRSFSHRARTRQLGYLPEEGFADIIENFWRELEARVGKGGRVAYWDWIGADTYEETIKRAYLTVFLVSYGYANVEANRLEETVVIIHNAVPRPDPGQAKISVPTLVDYEEWKLWRKG